MPKSLEDLPPETTLPMIETVFQAGAAMTARRRGAAETKLKALRRQINMALRKIKVAT